MTPPDDRLAGLSPEKRRLLRKRLAERRRASAPASIQRSGEPRAPLTFAQRRLWFLEQLAPGSPLYNNPSAIDGTGALDVDALGRAFEAIARRHEALRTRFVADGDADEAVQVVVPYGATPGGTLPLAVEDLRALGPDERDARARDLLVRVAEDPFDLAAGPPARALLVLRDERHWTLAVTFHHLVSDAWSSQRFLVELVAGYRAEVTGGRPALPELPIQYGDFARWQRGEASTALLESQRAYWLERLAGTPAALALPLDRPRGAAASHAGDTVRFELDRKTTDALRGLASEREGTTLFMVLLAGFSALLQRLTGDTDLCVGTAIAGRGRGETEHLIGLFANTIALRIDASGQPTFAELVERARETAVGAFAHPDVPFEQLVEALPVPRTPSIHPLFQVLFLLQNVPAGGNPVAEAGGPLAELGLGIEPRASSNRRARFDLTVSWYERDEGLAGAVEFATDLFDRSTVEGWCRAYATLLAAAAAAPETHIGELPLGLQPSIRLGASDHTRADTHGGEGVAERFAAVSARTPDAPAIGFENQRCSYGELERRADRLARRLVALGVGPETRVGLAAGRGVEEWVGMLAAWKAGAAYVPLDPAFPAERLAWMVESSELRWLLTSGAGAELTLPEGVRVVPIEVGERGDENVSLPEGDADRLAYVLYTSGSTGRPKGVGVSHRSALFFLDALTARLGWSDDVRLLAVTTLGFDIALLERWGPLLVGGTSHLVAADDAADGAALGRALVASGANALQGTPATWRLLRDAGWPEGAQKLTALAGGEALSTDLAHWIAAHADALWNLYGPTETTVWSSAHGFDAHGPHATGSVDLGAGLGATRLAVVDAELRPVPLGVWGELVIGGPGVARGYEGRGGETAHRFVPDPFDAAPGARLYRTGDVCRMLPGGGLAFGGRRDGQVKLRGYRVEIGEVEARLAASERVAAGAVVVAAETLVAFIVPASGELDVAALTAELSRALPAYMVPRRVEVRDVLPHTPNGKVDRRALAAAAAEMPGASAKHVEPRTATERALAEIFGEVLDLERVSTEASFFELGGHSLLATRVAARIRVRLGRELPLRALFEAPTVAALAARVDALEAAASGPALVAVPADERPESIPLSHAQERLWFLDQLNPGDPAYAIPLVLRLEGALDVQALEQALADVVRRHEVLRTTFPAVAGQPEQRIHAPGSPVALRAAAIGHMDLSSQAGEERDAAVRSHALDAAREPFDLAQGPLLRARLLRLGERSHLALLVMHHIVSDGWSIEVLARELAALYDARRAGAPSPLLPLAIQYADWSLHERASLADGALAASTEHWTRALSGVPAELTLPADRAGEAHGPRLAARRVVSLSPELVAGAHELARAHDATLFMVLLGAYAAALYVEGSGDDLVVGCPSAGREDPRVEGAIGFFVNTLPLRLRLGADRTLAEVVEEARSVTLSGLAHRRVPFARIAEAAATGGQTPASLGQLWFVLQNVPRPTLALGDLLVEPVPAEEIARMANGALPARYDLKLELLEEEGAVAGGFEYRVDRFDEATIERLAARFVEVLGAMTRTPEATLGASRRGAAERSAGDLADRRRRGLAGLRGRRAAGATPRARERVPGRTVRVDGEDLVRVEPPPAGTHLPGALTATRPDVRLDAWLAGRRDRAFELLRGHGALLFRGFALDSPAALEGAMRSLGDGEPLDYAYRSTPRSQVEGRVFTSTEYPPDRTIPQHSEQAYSRSFPRLLGFLCLTPPARGGATPVADNRRILARVPADVRARFERHGVLYVRNYGGPLDLGWREVFQTDDRVEVERFCEGEGIELEWGPGDRLRTRQVCPGVVEHPVTGEAVWFNQAHLFHASALGAEDLVALIDSCGEDHLPRQARFGNGDEIPADDLAAVRAAIAAETVRFDWRAGDLLLLDNLLACHGREPFEGERRVVVCMSGAARAAGANMERVG
ncbi:MAG: amino acid adenylation domain-containing protein [Planctomycetota bacterium]